MANMYPSKLAGGSSINYGSAAYANKWTFSYNSADVTVDMGARPKLIVGAYTFGTSRYGGLFVWDCENETGYYSRYFSSGRNPIGVLTGLNAVDSNNKVVSVSDTGFTVTKASTSTDSVLEVIVYT